MAPPNSQTTKPRSTGATERVQLRNEFYRDKFRAMATSMPILLVALLLSICMNFVLATRKPQDRYFAVDPAGRIVPIRSLQEPYVTDAYLATWVSEKVSRSYSMDPQNYRRQVGDLQPFYTPEGYEQYVQSLQSSGTIDLITKNLLVMSGVPMGAPIVAARGEVNGIYYWKVQIPMLVDFRSGTKTAQKKRIVEVTVVRRQTIESPDGIGISQFVASDS
ncbi:type IVB secretion system apparatus protein IcmL/DotI [Paucibacter soli]|uniref:type IVB secretion system apparatus protein IcmL/DotI n=1 Tax=Paucibacter soli TaxID=3133433 RepID=UPI0030B056A4